MSGVWRLTRLLFRTTWGSLLAWASGLIVLVLAMGSGIAGLYSSAAERQVYALTVAAVPATKAFNGRAYELQEVGGVLASELGLFGQIAVPLAGIFLAIGLTRAQEDHGRFDLLSAGRLTPHARLGAVLIVAGSVFGVFWLGATGGLWGLGYPLPGAARYCLMWTVLGLAFLALGLVLAEIFSNARSARLVGLEVVIGCFVVRAVIDAQGWDGVWISPLGWIAEARPWSSWRWWPLLAYAVLAASLIGLVWQLVARRDLGSGLVVPAPGPARGRAWLGTVPGWAWRMNYGSWLGWLAGVVVVAAGIGVLAESMGTAVAANPVLTELLGGTGQRVPLAIGLIAITTMASVYAVGGRITQEERVGRLALIFPAGRRRVWLTWWSLIVLQAVFLACLGGAVMGGVAALVTNNWELFGETVQAALGGSAVVLGFAGLAALVRAFIPALGALVFVPVLWIAVVGVLAESLRLPQWARDFSLLSHVGKAPIDPVNLVPALLSAGLGVLAVIGSAEIIARRELRAG